MIDEEKRKINKMKAFTQQTVETEISKINQINDGFVDEVKQINTYLEKVNKVINIFAEDLLLN